MSNDVLVNIDVANQSITSSDTSIITVPTQNFEIVTFDSKPCIRATNDKYATFTISPTIKSLSCDVFLQAVDGFTLLIEFDTVRNTKYSLVYYPHGKWWNPDSVVFDSNDVLVGVWVTVTYSSTNKTITFDNGTTQLTRVIDSNIVDLSIGNFGGRYNIYLTNLGAETSIRYANKDGIAEIWANIKNYITAQLLGKANSSHTHTKSQITDFPTIPTKTSDLTNDSGFLTSEIDSQGTSWVRFKSGIQICYGGVNNNNNLATGIARFAYPMAFIAKPNVVATPNISARYLITANVESSTTWVLNTYAAYGNSIDYVTDALGVNYVAIGKWK